MKKKCVICYNGINYFKRIDTIPGLGRFPVWGSLKDAMVFESKALAKDYLNGYWFDSSRKRCEIKAI